MYVLYESKAKPQREKYSYVMTVHVIVWYKVIIVVYTVFYISRPGEEALPMVLKERIIKPNAPRGIARAVRILAHLAKSRTCIWREGMQYCSNR